MRSDTLKTIINKSTQIIIISNNGKEKKFKNSFEFDNIIFEEFKYSSYDQYLNKNPFQKVLISLRAYILNGKYDTRTVDDFRRIFLEQGRLTKGNGIFRLIYGCFWETITFLFKFSKSLRKLIIYFESLLFSPSFHKELFQKYSPDLVLVTALCGFKHNELFAREAKKYGVPVCCVVLSWDNTSGMGMPGYIPDYVIAWTENMKRELIELNDIDQKKIFVGGVAHFDSYYKKNTTLTKDQLFRQLGLDTNKRTIFYATKSPKRFPWGPELLADLAKAIRDGHIYSDTQILVRIHPLHYRSTNAKIIFQDILDEYDKVAAEYHSVILNKPLTVSQKMDFDLSDSESKLVSSILKHSDLMLNMFSTMVIEAAIFDLPAVNICIRERCKVDFGKSHQDIMVDYYQSHNQRVIQTGGVKTVFTMEELYSTVNEYLDSPTSNETGRKKIVINEAGPFPGNAGEMIGQHILSLL